MLILNPHARDLGGFTVQRLLPSLPAKMIGPFIFFDHFGPIAFAPGDGADVRPHPHIGLATVTYLFEGDMIHRDSLGTRAAHRTGRRELDDRRAAASSIPNAPRRRPGRAAIACTASRPGSRCRRSTEQRRSILQPSAEGGAAGDRAFRA